MVNAAAPDTSPPDSRAPDSHTPDSRTPDSRAPDSRTPDSRAPDAALLDATPDATPDRPPEPAWWPDPGEAPAFDHPLIAAHPAAFAQLSRWHDRFGPVAGRPRTSFRGAFAVGNGRVFALAGLVDPLTTLHNLTGPTYNRGEAFFGDVALHLAAADGSAGVDGPTAGVIAQSLSAPVVLISSCWAAGCLEVIDLAAPGEPCVLRALALRGEAPAVVRLAAFNPVEAAEDADGAYLREVVGDRALISRLPGARLDEQALVRELAPGEVVITRHCATDPETPEPPPARHTAEAFGAALDALAAQAAAEAHQRVRLELPDPALTDYLRGAARTLSVQTSTSGGVSPMHRYTRLWLRDTIGPVLAWLDLGDHTRAAAAIDALGHAIRAAGDLRNSMPADLDPAEVPPAPDYAALPPLTGRSAAEAPSYLVWMHWALWRHTGALGRARAALPLLRRAVLAQAFDPMDRLPFSGDETFRIALDAAFELDLAYPHEEASWSANSAFLWLGAAGMLAELADALGDEALVELLAARRAEVDGATRRHYLGDDGCFAALIDRETGERSAPFEDVSLKVTWARWLPGSDPVARANIACLVDRLGRQPGVLQSPLAAIYSGIPALAGGAGDGVFTGMQPAYALSALTATEHPWAEPAFVELGRALTPSGNLQEYHVRADPPFGLSLLYDPTGREADQTPKLRPWEGGLAVHAVFEHLLGFEPDAPNSALRLRPRLPTGWPEARWRGLRVGPVRVAVHIEAAAVRVEADGPLEVTVDGQPQAIGPDTPGVWPR